MAVVRGGKPSFFERVARQRLPVGERAAPKRLEPAGARDKGKVVTLFEGSRLKAGSLAEHDASLKAIQPHLAALTDLTKNLDPADANLVHKSLESFADNLGRHLDLVPAQARPLLAATAASGLRELTTKLQGHRDWVAALAVSAQMLEATPKLVSQGSLDMGPAEHGDALRKPFDAVHDLVRRMDGREGTATALNALAHLSGRLEGATAHLTNHERDNIRASVSEFLLQTSPRSGLTQAMTADLSREVGAALANQEVKDYRRALQTAHDAFRAAGQPLREALRADLGRVPRGVEPGTPEEALVRASRRMLAHVVEENPTGPASLFDAVRTADAALNEQIRLATNSERVVPAHALAEGKFKPVEVPVRSPKAPSYEFTTAMRDLSTLVAEDSRSPSSAALLGFIAANAAELLSPAARADVAAAAVAPTPGKAAKALLQGVLSGLPAQCRTPDLAEASGRLAEVKGPEAFRILAAAQPHLANPQLGGPVLHGLVDYFQSQRGAPSAEDVTRFVDRLAPALELLQPHLGEGAATLRAAERLANSRANVKVDPAQLAAVVGAARAAAPEALADLLLPNASGQPGLLALADPNVRYRNGQPHPFFAQLTAPVAMGRLDAASKVTLTRQAAALAASVGNMDGDPALPFRQALADWTTAVSGQKQLQGLSAVEFFRAHPELPPELAATAALHLNAEQLAWVSEHYAHAKSRDQVRSMRNFVFAVVAQNRVDVLDVVRASKSPARVVSKTISAIGRDFRGGEAIPWNELSAGLKAGGDPVGEMLDKKAKAALAALGARAGQVDAGNQGIQDLQKAAKEIASIGGYLARYPDYQPAWQAAIDAAARGDWPTFRYDNAVGKRVMGRLTPKQQAAWRAAGMTTADGAAVAAEAQMGSATSLTLGLTKALPQEVHLEGVNGLAVAWDPASQGALVKLRDETLVKLRAAEKGSPEHRRLGSLLGVVQYDLAVIDLQLALSRPGAAKELGKIVPVLQSALRPLRNAGALGAAEAVEELLFDAQKLRPGGAPQTLTIPAKGTVATDEDGLATMVTSHQGGCLNPLVGQYRHELVVGLTNANFRMSRVYRDGKQVLRALFELLPVKMQNYEGHGIWVDVQDATGGGNAADHELLLRHILGKAIRVGVPLFYLQNAGNWAQAFPGKVDALPAQQVNFTIEEGTTGGMTHIDNLVGHSYNVRQARGNNPSVQFPRHVPTILMPKDKG